MRGELRPSQTSAPRHVLFGALIAACASGERSLPTAPRDGAGSGEAGVSTIDPATPTDPPDPRFGPEPTPLLIRRLTNVEYRNTARDLFPGSRLPELQFTADPDVVGLRSLSSEQSSDLARVEQYEAAAEAIAVAVSGDPEALTGCDLTDGGETACALAYLHDLGRRAYRRPLEDEEREAIAALFDAADDPRTGLELGIRGLLQSPKFLFRPELGVPQPGARVYNLTSFELATRLAYLITGSMPDAELFTAAESGNLRTPERIQEQAIRLLALPGAREHLVGFHQQWLGMDRASTLDKDPEAYPSFTPSLARAMAEEARRFVETLLFEADGTYEELFTAPYSFVDGELAAFYGVPPPNEDWARTELDLAERSGVLTQGALLATLAKRDATDPVGRGKFVLTRLLCRTIQPPPPDGVAMLPATDSSLTMRERFETHRSDPNCAPCHDLLDPIGLAFEHHDGAGAFRVDDGGRPIDVTGELFGTPFDGAVELARLVADHPEARACYLTQWFRFAFGRLEVAGSSEDDELISHLGERFPVHTPLKDLVEPLVLSNAFRFVRPEEAP